MFGYNVELEGIGTFSVSLKSRPVMEKNEIRAESIHFKDVKFRSSKELRDRLKTMPVFRDEYTVSDPAYPPPRNASKRYSVIWRRTLLSTRRSICRSADAPEVRLPSTCGGW